MWKSFWKGLFAPEPASAATDGGEAPFHVYRVEMPDGVGDVVSLLPKHMVFESGLSPVAVVGVCTELLKPGVGLTVDNFRPNRPFADLLHEVIAAHAPSVPELQQAAQQQRNGRVYVIDARTPTPQGDVPPEDILGSFEVQDGAVVANSYQANSNHRIFSARGLVELDPRLHDMLMERIMATVKAQEGRS